MANLMPPFYVPTPEFTDTLQSYPTTTRLGIDVNADQWDFPPGYLDTLSTPDIPPTGTNSLQYLNATTYPLNSFPTDGSYIFKGIVIYGSSYSYSEPGFPLYPQGMATGATQWFSPRGDWGPNQWAFCQQAIPISQSDGAIPFSLAGSPCVRMDLATHSCYAAGSSGSSTDFGIYVARINNGVITPLGGADDYFNSKDTGQLIPSTNPYGSDPRVPGYLSGPGGYFGPCWFSWSAGGNEGIVGDSLVAGHFSTFTDGYPYMLQVWGQNPTCLRVIAFLPRHRNRDGSTGTGARVTVLPTDVTPYWTQDAPGMKVYAVSMEYHDYSPQQILTGRPGYIPDPFSEGGIYNLNCGNLLDARIVSQSGGVTTIGGHRNHGSTVTVI